MPVSLTLSWDVPLGTQLTGVYMMFMWIYNVTLSELDREVAWIELTRLECCCTSGSIALLLLLCAALICGYTPWLINKQANEQSLQATAFTDADDGSGACLLGLVTG